MTDKQKYSFIVAPLLLLAAIIVGCAAYKGCGGMKPTPAPAPRTLVVVRETSNVPEWLASLLVQVRLKDNAKWFEDHGGDPIYYDPDQLPDKFKALPAPPSAGVVEASSGKVTASQSLSEGATVQTLKDLVVKGGG